MRLRALLESGSWTFVAAENFRKRSERAKRLNPNSCRGTKMSNTLTCCVSGCRTRHTSKSKRRLYRIPSGSGPYQAYQRQLWVEAIQRANGSTDELEGNVRICSAHFKSSKKTMLFFFLLHVITNNSLVGSCVYICRKGDVKWSKITCVLFLHLTGQVSMYPTSPSFAPTVFRGSRARARRQRAKR